MATAAWGAGGGPANPQQLNRYAYALNNPTTFTDPTGHCVFAAADTAFCATIAGSAAAAGPPGWFVAGAVVFGVGIIAMTSAVPDDTVSSVGGAEDTAARSRWL